MIRLLLTVVLVLTLLSFFGGYTGYVPSHIGYGGGGCRFSPFNCTDRAAIALIVRRGRGSRLWTAYPSRTSRTRRRKRTASTRPIFHGPPRGSGARPALQAPKVRRAWRNASEVIAAQVPHRSLSDVFDG